MNYLEMKMIRDYPITWWTSSLLGVFKSVNFTIGIIFLLLYCCDKIDWSLWFVTMPFWYPFPIVLLTFIIDFIILRFKNKKKKKNIW